MDAVWHKQITQLSWRVTSASSGDTGTLFLFLKARIPSRADPHVIIHSMFLPPKGSGTICDWSSQLKLPYLQIFCMHGDGRDLHSIKGSPANRMPVQGHLKELTRFCYSSLRSSVTATQKTSASSNSCQLLAWFTINIFIHSPHIYKDNGSTI